MSDSDDSGTGSDNPNDGVRLAEQGAPKDGEPQELDRRLYFQLLVFDIETPAGPRAMVQALGRKLAEKSIPSVIYEDVNDHRGLGLLLWGEDPGSFLTRVRPLLGGKRFSALTPRPGWVMFGRTYSTGYEPDLADWLLERPVRVALDSASSWAIWYPLRRKGDWAQLDAEKQSEMLREHGAIGRAWGRQGLASDIRLASFGLDPEDNDFVIGLLGKDLHPLSRVVEEMRSTGQTSGYLEKLGPFFVGRKAWQFPKDATQADSPEEEGRPERKRSRSRGRGRGRARQDGPASDAPEAPAAPEAEQAPAEAPPVAEPAPADEVSPPPVVDAAPEPAAVEAPVAEADVD
jgi:hypothetical protein